MWLCARLTRALDSLIQLVLLQVALLLQRLPACTVVYDGLTTQRECRVVATGHTFLARFSLRDWGWRTVLRSCRFVRFAAAAAAAMALSKVLMDRLFTYDTLVHAVSGAAGATVAMSVFYPLDTIRSRLQVEEGRESKSTVTMLRELMDDEGFEGLYRGLSPVLQSLWCSNFVYFYSFHGLRAVFSAGGSHSAGRDLALASAAGVLNVLLTTPMWVVNTRMKMQGVRRYQAGHSRCQPEASEQYNYRNIVHGLLTICREEGLSALWSSTLPSLILVSNPSIQFMVYEALKRRCELLGVALHAGTIFSLGAISKCVATVLTYPLQLVQSKMRYSNDQRSMLEVTTYVIRNFGIQGLYKGLESKLFQTVLTAALMFMAYEKIAALVFSLMRVTSKTTA